LLRAVATGAAGVALASAAFSQKIAMTAILDGAQETPPVATAAKGTAFCVLDRDANTLTYTIQVTGLSSAEQLAHIHGFAPPGTPAGIKQNLALGLFKTGVWNYAEVDEANIVAGLAYFNVHTVNNGGGEIRGQIVKSDAPATLFAVANGAQETPPTGSAATGVGWVKVDTIANTLTYSFTFNGLGSAEQLAHIHGFAPAGTPAGIKFNLALGNHKTGTVAYPQGDEANYLAGLSYFNVHSVNFGGGEIRGQILPGETNPNTYCTSKTNSQGCLPTIGSSGLPNLAAPDDFHVTCSSVLNNKSGIFYFGFAPKAAPFGGGTQCVASPTLRTPIQNSGGNAPPDDCSGVFDYFFTDAALASAGSAGTQIYGEYWSRDPSDPATFSLSNGIQFAIMP
jgi:hypothetical protein